MDAFIKQIKDLLNDDSNLSNLTSNVNFWRREEDPQKIPAPLVVFKPAPGGTENTDYHGAASEPQIEVDVWGYNHDGSAKTAPDCVRVGQRVRELFISNRLGLSRGGHTRWVEVAKFQFIERNDPDEILYRGRFSCRYWSGGDIDAIVANS